MSEWLKTQTNGIGEWFSTTINNITVDSVNALITGVGNMIVNLEGLFIIIALVGVYFMIFGDKKFGTKITSGSILIYLLGVVIANAK